MTEYMVWIWLIVLIVMLVLEFMTADFLTVWFAISAVPTVVIAAIWPQLVWIQVLFFFLFGFLLMIIVRKYVIKYIKKNIVSTNVDSFIGKTALVIKDINPVERGLVEFENDTWTAVSKETIEIGEHVKILAIEGNKLIVTKYKEEIKWNQEL